MFLVSPTKLSYQDHIDWLLHHRYKGELEEELSIIHGISFFFPFYDILNHTMFWTKLSNIHRAGNIAIFILVKKY